MKEIIAQFAPDVVNAFLKKEAGDAATEIHRVLQSAGASIGPLHPASDDPALSRYFVIHVADDGKAEELASRLRTFKSTEAAYVKPAGEAP